MGGELFGVVVGGGLAIISSVLTTFVFRRWEHARERQFIAALLKAELVAIQEKCERYLQGKSTLSEYQSSMPLWNAALKMGYLPASQVVAARRCVVLDMEARDKGNQAKVQQCLEACREALLLF